MSILGRVRSHVHEAADTLPLDTLTQAAATLRACSTSLAPHLEGSHNPDATGIVPGLEATATDLDKAIAVLTKAAGHARSYADGL